MELVLFNWCSVVTVFPENFTFRENASICMEYWGGWNGGWNSYRLFGDYVDRLGQLCPT